MTEYYRGERVADLLKRIEELKAIIDENAHLEPDPLKIVVAYADLAIAKAKFTALKGEK